MTTGERLRKARKALHVTQKDLSEKLGITQAGISSIESGRVNLTDRLAQSIQDVYRINADWLRTGEGEMLVEPSEDEQLAEFVGEILAGRPDDMRRQFLVALSQLDEDGWKGLVQFTRAIYKEGKKLEEGKEKEQG